MKVLVVVDMQNDFVYGALGNAECQAAVEPVIKLIGKKYDHIFFTRDTHKPNYMETNEGFHLPVVHCIEGSDGWQLCDAVEEAKEKAEKKGVPTTVIDKPTFGSMMLSKELMQLSKACEKESDLEIDFCGVCTGICVLSNVAVAKATVPEAKISVESSACACVTPASHKTALDAMAMIHINIRP